MKSNRNLIIGIFSIVLIVTISCSKDDPAVTPSNKTNEQTIDLSVHEIFLNGQPIEKMIQGDEVTSIIDSENRITYQFTDEEAFREWSTDQTSLKSTNSINLYEIYADMKEISQLAEDLGIAETYEYGDELPQEMLTLLEELGYSENLSEKNAITWTTLYDNVNYEDQLGIWNTQFVPALAPDHRNRAESMKLIGLNGTWYCDRTWFRGEKRYFITLTHYFLPDFLDFNNKIESIFAVI